MGSPIRFRFKIAISACYHNSRNTLECWRNALKRSVEGGGGVGSAETTPDEAGKNITNASAKQRKFFSLLTQQKKTRIYFFLFFNFNFLRVFFYSSTRSDSCANRSSSSFVGCIVDNVAAVIV